MWIEKDLNRKISKNYIIFQIYVLENLYNKSCWIFTYLKRNLLNMQVEQWQGLLSCSLNSFMLKLKSLEIFLIFVVNLYNCPCEFLEKRKTIATNCILLIEKYTLWISDFNQQILAYKSISELNKLLDRKLYIFCNMFKPGHW